MSLAGSVGLTVPQIALRTHGAHQVFMIERFDRGGDPACPQRRLFASAHSVLQLEPSAVRGDPRRSYLHLADAMRRWGAGDARALKRMVFNALVGNVDDHPRNHGLLHDGHGWRLSPAFDITPMFTVRHGDRPSLSMATGLDGHVEAGLGRFLGVAAHFGLEVDGGRGLVVIGRANRRANGSHSCARRWRHCRVCTMRRSNRCDARLGWRLRSSPGQMSWPWPWTLRSRPERAAGPTNAERGVVLGR